jgi:hypothetical protein
MEVSGRLHVPVPSFPVHGRYGGTNLLLLPGIEHRFLCRLVFRLVLAPNKHIAHKNNRVMTIPLCRSYANINSRKIYKGMQEFLKIT